MLDDRTYREQAERSMRLRDAILNDPILALLRRGEIERRNFSACPAFAVYKSGGELVMASIEPGEARRAREEFERKSRERIEEITNDHDRSRPC